MALPVATRAADQSWSGTISDSMCGASHRSAIEHAGKSLSDGDCVAACIKEGAKYVFVHDGKVYKIENQDLAALKEHGGHDVILTGEMTGDSIRVTKVEMAKQKAKSS
jgi:hypothetical protein